MDLNSYLSIPLVLFIVLFCIGIKCPVLVKIAVIVIFIISLVIVTERGRFIFDYKFLCIIVFVIMPLISGALVMVSNEGDNNVDRKDASSVVVYLYNRSSEEQIDNLTYSLEEKPRTFSDLCYYFKHLIGNGMKIEREKRALCPNNSIVKMKISAGTYKLNIVTQNKSSGIRYSVDLNQETITFEEGKEYFLCYYFLNLFEFYPPQEQMDSIHKLKKVLEPVKWDFTVLPPERENHSVYKMLK